MDLRAVAELETGNWKVDVTTAMYIRVEVPAFAMVVVVIEKLALASEAVSVGKRALQH